MGLIPIPIPTPFQLHAIIASELSNLMCIDGWEAVFPDVYTWRKATPALGLSHKLRCFRISIPWVCLQLGVYFEVPIGSLNTWLLVIIKRLQLSSPFPKQSLPKSLVMPGCGLLIPQGQEKGVNDPRCLFYSFTVRVIAHRQRLPGKVRKAPSLYIFKI